MKKLRVYVMRSSRVLLAMLIASPPVAAACEIRIGPDEINYGELQRAEAMNDGSGKLEFPLRTIALNIECEEPRHFTLLMDAPPGKNQADFGFGALSDVRVRVVDARLDDQQVLLSDGRLPASDSATLSPNTALTAMQGSGPMQGHRFTAQLRLIPLLKSWPVGQTDVEQLEFRANLRLLD